MENEALLEQIIEWLNFYKEIGIEEINVNYKRKSKEEELTKLINEIGDCRRCPLHEKRKKIVIGDGNLYSKVIFVGEAPGEEEDNQGLPFVGKAGQLLNKILAAIDLKREDVYICNIVKCRPPQNRIPFPKEIETCEPFLTRQIEIINPKLIVALGAPAAQTLLKTKMGITELRSKFFKFSDDILVFPTYHPAFLLRNPNKKREAWEDFKKIKKFIAEFDKIGEAENR